MRPWAMNQHDLQPGPMWVSPLPSFPYQHQGAVERCGRLLRLLRLWSGLHKRAPRTFFQRMSGPAMPVSKRVGSQQVSLCQP